MSNETIAPPIGLVVEKVGDQYELYARFLNRQIAERAATLANAAPDLLEACKAAIAACDAIYEGRLNWHGSLRPLELICKANKDARAAIANAERM